MAGVTASVEPPFRLYRLETEAGTRNARTTQPAVYLREVGMGDDLQLHLHVLTTIQARELAQGLIAAADEAQHLNPAFRPLALSLGVDPDRFLRLDSVGDAAEEYPATWDDLHPLTPWGAL